MSQEVDASEWGFLEGGLEEPGKTISCSESWGFDDAIHATEMKHDFHPGRGANEEEGDDADSQLVSMPLPIQHKPRSPTVRSAMDMLKALSHSTRDGLNSLGIQEIFDLEARTLPDYEDNLFHVLANPRLHTAAYRQRPWSERLEVARQVVEVLVGGGVDINARNGLSLTPLLTAVNIPGDLYRWHWSNMIQPDLGAWAEGPTIIALLEQGADPTIYGRGDTILTRWLKVGLGVTPEPEGFDQILRLILARLPNINARYYPINSGFGTFLHHLVTQEDDPNYVRRVLHNLHEIELHHPLNVNALDSEGNTPILALFTRNCGWPKRHIEDNVLEIAQTLLDMGAQIDFISAKGLTVFGAVASSYGWLPRSDQDFSHVLQQLVKLEQSVTKTTGHSTVIKAAPLSFLAHVLHQGHTKTAAVLLRYGMKDKLGLEQIMPAAPSWLADDLFRSAEDDWIAASVFEQLAKVREPGRRRASPMNPNPPLSVSSLAFCGLGRTRLFAWSLSFALFYPMFALAGSDDRPVAGKDHWGRLEADTKADCSAAETDSSRDLSTDSTTGDPETHCSVSSTTDELLEESNILSRSSRTASTDDTTSMELKIVRSRPSLRRAHSCPGTEEQWRHRLGDRKGPISEYYWYSRRELRTVAWRRDSTPDLNSTLAVQAPLDKLRLYVFRSDGGNIRSTKTLQENDPVYSPADEWVSGRSISSFTRFIPHGLDARLEELEMWQSTSHLFLSDPDGSISRAREAIQSTVAAGHIPRPTWLASLAHKLATRYEQNNNVADLDEAIGASRQAVKSTPESEPHREWLTRLAIMLTKRYNHDEHGRVSDLNEAIDIYRELIGTNASFTSTLTMANNLEALALNLAMRFKRTGDRADLDESIHLGRQIYKHLRAVASDVDEDRILRDLGIRLSWRYPGVFNLENEDNAIIRARAFLDILATQRDWQRRQT